MTRLDYLMLMSPLALLVSEMNSIIIIITIVAVSHQLTAMVVKGDIVFVVVKSTMLDS